MDAVEREAVGVVGGDELGGEVEVVVGLGLAGHFPPAVVVADELGVAAAVDGAVAHDAGVADVVGVDEGSAAAARAGGGVHAEDRKFLGAGKAGAAEGGGGRFVRLGIVVRDFVDVGVAGAEEGDVL